MNYVLESLGFRELLSSAGSALADVFYIKVKPAAYSLTRKGMSILARRVPSNKGLFVPFRPNSGILSIIEQIERLSQDSPFSYELYVTIQGDILRNKLGSSELEKIYDGKTKRFLDKTVSYSAQNVFKIGLNLRTLQDYVNEVYRTSLNPEFKELFPLYGLQPQYVKDLSKDKTNFLRIIFDIMGKADVMQMSSRDKSEFYTDIRNKMFEVKMDEQKEANWYNSLVLDKMISIFQREGNYDKVVKEMYNDLVQTGKVKWFIEYPSLKKYKLANDQSKLYFNSTTFNTTNPYVEKWDLIDKAIAENQPSLIGALGERAKNLGFKGFIGTLFNPMLIGAITLGAIKAFKHIMGNRRLDRIEGVIEGAARLQRQNERLLIENNQQQNRYLNALRDVVLIQGIRLLDWMGNNQFGGGYHRNDVFQIGQGVVNQIDMIQNQNDNNILRNVNALIDDDLPFVNNRNVRQRRNSQPNGQMPLLPPPQEPQRILPPPPPRILPPPPIIPEAPPFPQPRPIIPEAPPFPQPRPRIPEAPPFPEPRPRIPEAPPFPRPRMPLPEPRPRMPLPEPRPRMPLPEPRPRMPLPQNNLQRGPLMLSFKSKNTSNSPYKVPISALRDDEFDYESFEKYLSLLNTKNKKPSVYNIANKSIVSHKLTKSKIYAARIAISKFEGREPELNSSDVDQVDKAMAAKDFFLSLPSLILGKEGVYDLDDLNEVNEDSRQILANFPKVKEELRENPDIVPFIQVLEPENIQGMDFILALNNYLALLDNTVNRAERMGGRMNRIWSKLTEKKYYQVFIFLIFSRGMLNLPPTNLAEKLCEGRVN